MTGSCEFTAILRGDLPAPAVAMARALLGAVLVRRTVHGVAAGRIVETEAYPPGDPAMHAYRGMTPRTRPLFLPHGHAYVYVCYGLHRMLNLSAEGPGVGAAVLVRAVEPLAGLEIMARNRRAAPGQPCRIEDLARGPGRLAQAMDIGLDLNCADLCVAGPLFVARGVPPARIGVSARIGLTRAADAPLRFFVPGSRSLSGPARLNAG